MKDKAPDGNMAEAGRIAVTHGNDRCGNLARALDSLRDEIASSIANKGSDTLFVKVNAIDSNFPLACTHPQALESVLDWLAPYFKHIVVGDNSFVFSKLRDRHPYVHLKARFPSLRFSDLIEFPNRSMELRGIDGTKTGAPYSTLPEAAFTVSLSLPKTHDAVIFSGCSKNMFGCVLRNRLAMHAVTPIERISIARFVRSNATIHYNLSAVIENLKADLAVMDAYEAMEGQGPLFGAAVSMKLALVSSDPIALDALACELAHLPLPEYLEICGRRGLGCTRPSEVHLIGRGFKSREEIERPLRPHYLQPFMLMREQPRGFRPRLDLRLVLAYARRFHRLVDKLRETWENNRREEARDFSGS